jgi:hypothetical protein
MWRNRTVCLAGITLALLAGGCVVDDGHSHPDGYHPSGRGGGPGPDAQPVLGDSGLRVSWDLAYLDGQLTDCASAGTPTVVLRAQLRATGDRFRATFPCEARGGITTDLPAGLYDLGLDLLDTEGRTVSTLDHPDVRLVPGTITDTDEVAELPLQTWNLEWSIGLGHRNGGTFPLSCADVGGVSVRFTTQLAGEPPESFTLPCEDYNAISTAIRPGDYQVRLLLIDGQGRVLGDTGPGSVQVNRQDPARLAADFDL